MFSITASALIGGATYFGMLERRVSHLLEEARTPGVIIFIDEIHSIVNSGPGDSNRSISQQLKIALSSGEIICIGATTDEEYRQYIATDSALERRFQPVYIAPLSKDQTLGILRSLRDVTQSQTGLCIRDDALRNVLNYAEKYMPTRCFPDSAIDLFEHTVAYAESEGIAIVSREDVEIAIKRAIGIPENIEGSLLQLSESIKEKRILTESQTRNLCDVLSVSMQGMNLHPKRPKAVMLLAGDTGNQADSLGKVVSSAFLQRKKESLPLTLGI
ncbi:MAG: ATP-dependent Clp protease ATP-binding subunit [Chloracidobacterium sp.]|nr:ATP-dependent Clp protease ATP-binding subunit [Chloracidobacterium sp.]